MGELYQTSDKVCYAEQEQIIFIQMKNMITGSGKGGGGGCRNKGKNSYHAIWTKFSYELHVTIFFPQWPVRDVTYEVFVDLTS